MPLKKLKLLNADGQLSNIFLEKKTVPQKVAQKQLATKKLKIYGEKISYSLTGDISGSLRLSNWEVIQ